MGDPPCPGGGALIKEKQLLEGCLVEDLGVERLGLLALGASIFADKPAGGVLGIPLYPEACKPA
jgi:hypothetical protein